MNAVLHFDDRSLPGALAERQGPVLLNEGRIRDVRVPNPNPKDSTP